jgi:hypothetical protein
MKPIQTLTQRLGEACKMNRLEKVIAAPPDNYKTGCIM